MVCFFGLFRYGIGYGFGVKTYLSFQFQVNKKERVYANLKFISRNILVGVVIMPESK